MNLITFSHNLPACYNIIEYDFDLNQKIRKKLIEKYKPKKNRLNIKPIERINNVKEAY